MRRLIPLILLIFFTTGCSFTFPGGIADSNVPITDYSYVNIVGPAHGSSSSFILFWSLPLGKADIKAALNQAMADSNADALVDITWETTYTHFFFFPISILSVKVNATAIQFKG